MGLSMDLSISLSMDLSIDLSIDLSMGLSIDLSMGLSMGLSMDLSISLSPSPSPTPSSSPHSTYTAETPPALRNRLSSTVRDTSANTPSPARSACSPTLPRDNAPSAASLPPTRTTSSSSKIGPFSHSPTSVTWIAAVSPANAGSTTSARNPAFSRHSHANNHSRS